VAKDHLGSTSTYYVVFAALVALVLLNIGISFAHIGGGAFAVHMAVAGVQALLLSVFFMHLKSADRLTWLVAGAGLFWLAILFVLTLGDYLTRQWATY
jgi:cytochrome c oxidase subunit 4